MAVKDAKYFFIAVFSITASLFIEARGFSQNAVNDVLGKPAVWKNLLASPQDSVLWVQYVGKPWVCMSRKDINNVKKIRNRLLQYRQPQTIQEEVNVRDDRFWILDAQDSKAASEVEILSKEQQNYLHQLETNMLQEPGDLPDLKQNIAENFVILEDTYQDAFDEMGIEYKSYALIHPDGKYSQELWIKEKSRELKELKVKKLNQMKAVLSNQLEISSTKTE